MNGFSLVITLSHDAGEVQPTLTGCPGWTRSASEPLLGVASRDLVGSDSFCSDDDACEGQGRVDADVGKAEPDDISSQVRPSGEVAALLIDTPLVAVESGVITKANHVDVGLGGITLWLTGNSGTRYYYAHNAINAVRLGEHVQAGQIVAYVGNTGNTGNAATTPPHVHLQVHPGGRDPVNPYPVLSVSCAGLAVMSGVE